MKKLEIKWLSDANDCESCGGGYAEGAEVFIDGECVLSYIPHATCFDSTSYDNHFIYQEIFDLLGYNLVASYE